jgi:hypothetical protein
VVDTATRSSNPIIPGLIAQLDSNFDLLPKSSDAQFRWTRTYAARNSIAAGLEWAESTRPQQLRQDNFSHLPGEASPRSTLSISDKPRSTIGYAFVQVEDGSIEWQGLLSYTSFSQPRQFESVGPPPFSFRFAVSDPFSRNGVAGGAAVIARLAGGGVGRLACSRWQRPVSNGTLAPVSLGGIVVDDQLVNAGGRSDRCHIQAEHQIGTSTFVLASYDYQKIDNLTSRLDGVINTGTEISNLDRLRNRAVAPPLNFNELESRPVFGSARVSRLQLGLDQLVTASVALRANYTQADSQNTSPDLRGKWIPYLPRSQLNFWLSYTMPSRGVMSVGPVYRSKRFADEANLSELQAGWDTEVRGYWEFDKKRWAVEAFAQNLAKKQTARVAGANISYRY